MKIIVIISLIAFAHTQVTTFKSKNGHNYDFTKLVKSPYWEVRE